MSVITFYYTDDLQRRGNAGRNAQLTPGEGAKTAVHDNRMFAERAFYCIANGAGKR